MKKILVLGVLCWLIASIIASVVVSCNPDKHWEVIESRRPLLIVDCGVYEIKMKCNIASDYWSNGYEGYNEARDEFIWYKGEHEIGKRYLTINIFCPLTNYDSDVLTRIDIPLN